MEGITIVQKHTDDFYTSSLLSSVKYIVDLRLKKGEDVTLMLPQCDLLCHRGERD